MPTPLLESPPCVGYAVYQPSALPRQRLRFPYLGRRWLFTSNGREPKGLFAAVYGHDLMEKTRTPLRVWFFLIFLMANQKTGLSVLGASRMLGIPYDLSLIHISEPTRLGMISY